MHLLHCNLLQGNNMTHVVTYDCLDQPTSQNGQKHNFISPWQRTKRTHPKTNPKNEILTSASHQASASHTPHGLDSTQASRAPGVGGPEVGQVVVAPPQRLGHGGGALDQRLVPPQPLLCGEWLGGVR